jgi:TonB family protein
MKVSLLLVGVLVVSLVVRQRSAALRHFVLAAAVVCACAIPLLESMLPAWRLAIGAAAFEPYDAVPSDDSSQAAPRPRAEGARTASAPAMPPSKGEGLGLTFPDLKTLWLIGVAFSAGMLIVGLLRLTWLARGAHRVTAGRWYELVGELSTAYGLRRPVTLLQSDHPSLLVTWGFFHPKVILPSPASEWSDARARIVLSHELAHIGRGDWSLQMVAEALRAFHWFNPILWIVCRRLRLESEHACDDEVMRRGVAGTDYATHLVELARSLRQRRQLWLPAAAMARPSSLERRVRAMLIKDVNRRPIKGVTRVLVFALLLLVSAVIAAAQSSFVSLSGLLADEQGKGVPGSTVILSNEARQAKYEVKTNELGRYEFVGLPAGDYGLEIKAIGFQALKDAIAVKGQNLQRSYSLKLGTLQETITVRFDPNATPNKNAPEKPPVVREVPMPARKECIAAPSGGQIRPPRKVRDVVPRYPRALEGTGTEGVVVMQARIDREGYTADISVVGDAQPDLAQAAIDAVRDWRFTETLLNCQPVDVTMTITTNFRPVPLPPTAPPKP